MYHWYIWITISLTLLFSVFAVSQNPSGISYDQIIEKLGRYKSIHQTNPIDGKKRYIGNVSNSSGRISNYAMPGGIVPGAAIIDIIGDKSSISQATLQVGLWVLEGNVKLFPEQRAMVLRFLKNALPMWKESADWIEQSLQRISADLVRYPKESPAPVSIIKGNILVSISFSTSTDLLAVTIVGL